MTSRRLLVVEAITCRVTNLVREPINSAGGGWAERWDPFEISIVISNEDAVHVHV